MTALDISETEFGREVVEASHRQPVLVDFWAPWCAPCRSVGPVLEKLAGEANGRWVLVKINTDESQALSAELGISGIPALKLYRNGGILAELTGALPEREMRAWLSDHIPSPERVRLEAARAARVAGRVDEAQRLAGEVLQSSPEDGDARLLLAELAIPADPVRAAELLDGIGPGLPDARIEATQQLVAYLQMQCDATADSERRYVEGAEALRQARYGDAAEALLDVLKRDRNLDDDGARRTLVALFTWLGDEHEVTRAFRPRLASALF